MKNEAQVVLMLVKGAISDLTPEQKAEVDRIAGSLRQAVTEGRDLGPIAFALVGAEMQVEAAK